MAISDVVIIVVVALGALLGLFFGTGKTFISIIGWAGSFIIALFLTSTVAYALISIPFVETMVFDMLTPIIMPFSVGVPTTGILGAIFNPLTSSVARLYTGTAAELASAAVFAYALFSAVVCLLLFLVVRLVMMLVTLILKKIILRSGKKPSPVSRLGGFVLGGVKGGFFAVIIFMIAAFGLVFPFGGDLIGPDIDKSFIAKPVFEIAAPFSSQMIGGGDSKLDARINEIVQKSGVLDNMPQEYTVTFDTNGGNEIESQKLLAGDKIFDPGNPTKDGYTFDGWYDNAECTGTKIDLLTMDMPAENITLYANWIENASARHTVTFVTNGDNVINPRSLFAGESISDPGDPTKEAGYTFMGWYDNAECLGERIVFPMHMPDKPLTLYAKWISDAQQTVYDSFVGENSILYQIGGGDRDHLDSVYFRDGMLFNDIDLIEFSLDMVADNIHLLTAEQIPQMEALLAADGELYLALESLLVAIQDFAEQGGPVEIIPDSGFFIWAANEPFQSAYEGAWDAFGEKIDAMYITFGWEIPTAP